MMKYSVKKTLALLLTVCMILSMLPATVFAASTLAPADGWTIMRQDEKITINSQNSITITTQAGDFDQQASSGNPENYWLRTPADEDFTLTAKFSGGMTANYHKAGILVYKDDDTIASVVRRYHSGLTTTDTSTKEGNVLGMFQWLGAWGEACVKDPSPNEDVWLKLVKVGDQFTGYYRFSESDEWTMLSTLTNATVAGAEDMKIGVFALNGTGSRALDVTIEDFTYQGADDEEAILIPFAAETETKVDVESVKLDASNLTLLPEETDSLNVSIVPSYATDKAVTWTSSDEDVVTVDNGTVTAVGEGKATITATADGISAQCAVQVVDVEGSNSVYVSDLDWNDTNVVQWTTGWRNPGLDAGVNNSGTIDIGGVNFPKGIAVHAASEVNINIKDMQARYFWAYIGINDNQTATSNAHFVVQADGVELYRRDSVTYAMDAIRVLVEIPEGAETLTLITDPNGSNNSDHTCWADAKILLPEGDGIVVANMSIDTATGRDVYSVSECPVAMSVSGISPVTAPNKDVVWSVEPAETAAIDADGNLTVTAGGTYTVTATAADGGGASASMELKFGSGSDWTLDETTKSGWIGTYGSDGWVLAGWDAAKDVSSLPYYIESIDYIFQDRSGGYVARTAADSTATGWDVALPHPDDPDGTRKLAYQFDDKAMTLRITANDDYEHKLTIYSVSENDRSRKQTLLALDPDTGLPISNAVTTDSMQLGKYYTISFSGSVDVLLYNENYNPLNTNVVVNGIFFDTDYPEGDIAARAISVSPADGEVVRTELGQVQMEATVWPTETTDKSVTWSVDNTDVATVDESGVVTILKPGAFNVTAVANSNNQVVDTVSMVAMDNAAVPEQAEIQLLGDAFAMLQNKYVRVLFNLETGYYSVYEQASGLPYVLNAYFQVNAEKSYKGYTFTASEIASETGKTLRLTGVQEGKNDLVLDIGLENETGDILMRAGITNKSGKGVKVMQMYPMVAKFAEKGGIFVGPNPAENHALLTGEGNWAVPQVKQGVTTTSKNNLMLSYRNNPELESFLIGQLTTYSFQSTITTAYNDAASFVNNGRGSIDADIRIYDNTGKLVDDDATYVGDVALLNFTTKNPYDSLDAYAWRQAEVMEVDLIDFDPYVYECLWYVNWYTSNANNADFAVQEVKDLYEKGLANYAIPNIRVEPDTYVNPNEQLWWDDEHWLAFGHMTETYPTVKDWLSAMHELGAEGGLYMQASYRSNDYCALYPGHMVGNDPNLSPDYTDPDFQAHMREVYENLKDAGLKSLFFDYAGQFKTYNPSTGSTSTTQLLNRTGGFEDPYATAVEAYRMIYTLAKETVGPDLRVTENIWQRTGEDVAIGLIDIQRNIGDTNEFDPTIAKVALNQWYRHRKTKLLYSDVKVFDDDNTDLRRAQITGTGFFFGKTTLGESVNLMSEDKIQDIGKIVPFPVDGIAARPVGLFEGGYEINPEVMDYEFDSEYDDHILLFWNQTGTEAKDISANLGLDTAFGGVGLDENKEYEVWDFWNWEYIGRVKGSDILTQNVRPDEMRTMAVREIREAPYLLSTNRHVLQGTEEIDVKAFAYDAETHTITGTFDIVGNDTYKAIIALSDNELLIDSFEFDNEAVTGQALLNVQNNYIEITLDAEENQTVSFTLKLTEGTLIEDTTAPGAITGLTAVADDFANITLSWNESVDDNDFVQVSYQVYGGTTADEAVLLTTTTAATFADITPRVGEFWYKVCAVDGMGNTTEFATIMTDAEILAVDKGSITMTAGDSEPGEGPERTIDDNTKTLWHTNWDGTDRANMWLDMAFAEPTLVNTYDYMPRTTESRNGVITKYELHASTDGGLSYEKIAEGEWTTDDGWKTIRFQDMTVTNLKLVAVASVGNFASAAEVQAYRTAAVERVEVRQSELNIVVGDQITVVADIYPTNLQGEALTYTSDNDTIASVDENGVVTGVAYGTAVITVTAANGVGASCTVNVDKTPLTKLQEAAVAELTAYRAGIDNEDYRSEQIAELDTAVEVGIAAINAAESIKDVTAALNNAKAALDAVKTDEELTNEELSGAADAARAAQAAAEAAQRAAEEAQAAAEKAAASAAEDKTAAEYAKAAAEAAQKLAEEAKAAAEAAKIAAEAENEEAALEAARAAESAAAAANAAATASTAAADAQAAQAAAETARKAAGEAAESAAADKAAAETAAASAELAKTQAEAAKAAAETAKTAAETAAKAAEESNVEAAKEAAASAASAAESAASASAAAGSAKDAADAAKAAQNAQAAAEAAQTAAEEAAESATEDRAGAETARTAAELAKEQAETALAAALKAQTAAEAAAEAAEESNVEAAKEAAASAAAAKESATSASAAAGSAKDAADAAKAAQDAQASAEAAQKAAEEAAKDAAADKEAVEEAKKEAEEAAAQAAADKAAAEKAKAEAEKIAAEAVLALAKYNALIELNEYAEALKVGATDMELAAIAEAAAAARGSINASAEEASIAEALEAGKAALDNALCLAKNFTDVDLDEWYHDAIDFVLKEGIMNGNGNGTFGPTDALTRAMMVQILYNVEGRPKVKTDKPFSDVDEDDWYYDAVIWAAENGIVLGYGDGSFGAEDNVTREQMVTILYRYAGEPDVTAEKIIFADSDEISSWAVEAVLWAYESGIVQGVGNDMFDPAGNSERAAAAQVMMKYFTK